MDAYVFEETYKGLKRCRGFQEVYQQDIMEYTVYTSFNRTTNMSDIKMEDNNCGKFHNNRTGQLRICPVRSVFVVISPLCH